MILPKFDYQAPESVPAVCSLLTQAGDRAAIMAGGTDLVVQMKQRTQVPEVVVGLRKINELKSLSYSKANGLKIGSMVTLQNLASSAVVRDHFPVLAEAASSVGAVQHQGMGTVGGNLCLDTRCWHYNQPADWRQIHPACHKLGGNTCHTVKGANKCYAVYSGDVGTVLFALDARIILTNSHGEKVISLEDFFVGDGVKPTNLQKDELVTGIIVPPQNPQFARYYKLRPREALDFAQLGIVLIAFPEKKEYRAVFNAVAEKPLRFKNLESMLSEGEISESLVGEFTSKVVSRIKPVGNVSGSPAYRRKMAAILLRMAFAEMGNSHE
jgi:4-hydroxybenzoyl-CoA reductase subunit beta